MKTILNDSNECNKIEKSAQEAKRSAQVAKQEHQDGPKTTKTNLIWGSGRVGGTLNPGVQDRRSPVGKISWQPEMFTVFFFRIPAKQQKPNNKTTTSSGGAGAAGS